MAYTPTINYNNYALTARTEEISKRINALSGQSSNTLFTKDELARVTRGENDTRTDEEIQTEGEALVQEKTKKTDTPLATQNAEQSIALFNANPKNAEKVAEGQAKIEQTVEENNMSLEKGGENMRSIANSLSSGSDDTMWYGLNKDYRTINPYDTSPKVEQTATEKMYSELFYAGQTAGYEKLYATQGQSLAQFRNNAKKVSDMIWGRSPYGGVD